MHILRRIKHVMLAFVLLAPCALARADWDLDNTVSTVNFVSVKNDTVGELHSFTSLLGYITDAGKAEITIDLGSVETAIDVRNERMRETLFEVVTFPTAKISAQVDPAVLTAAAEGGVLTADVPVTLSLHGKEKALTIPVVVVGESGKRLHVYSTRPVLINAADFDLDGGVAALQKIANLQAISTSVPVTLQLVFNPAK